MKSKNSDKINRQGILISRSTPANWKPNRSSKLKPYQSHRVGKNLRETTPDKKQKENIKQKGTNNYWSSHRKLTTNSSSATATHEELKEESIARALSIT